MTCISGRSTFAALVVTAMSGGVGAVFADCLTAQTSTATVAEEDTFQLALSGEVADLTAAPDPDRQRRAVG